MVEKKGKSRGLGRGLSSLMGDFNNEPVSNNLNSENQAFEKLVPVEKIYPNPNQPRKSFQEEKLIELANSLLEKEVIFKEDLVRIYGERPFDIKEAIKKSNSK